MDAQWMAPIASNSTKIRLSCYGLDPKPIFFGKVVVFRHYNSVTAMTMFVYWEQRSHPILVLTDTSPTSALRASTGYGSSDASGAHWTWTRPQHWPTHSYRRVSTIATFCWQVRRKWSLTGCNGYWMLLRGEWKCGSRLAVWKAEPILGYFTLTLVCVHALPVGHLWSQAKRRVWSLSFCILLLSTVSYRKYLF